MTYLSVLIRSNKPHVWFPFILLLLVMGTEFFGNDKISALRVKVSSKYFFLMRFHIWRPKEQTRNHDLSNGLKTKTSLTLSLTWKWKLCIASKFGSLLIFVVRCYWWTVAWCLDWTDKSLTLCLWHSKFRVLLCSVSCLKQWRSQQWLVLYGQSAVGNNSPTTFFADALAPSHQQQQLR